MRKMGLTSVFFFICLGALVAQQRTIGELNRIYKHIGDSIIANYVGADFTKAHFRIDFSRSYFKGNNQQGYGADNDTTILINQPARVELSYNFFPDQKYGSYLCSIILKEDGTVTLSQKFLSHLQKNLGQVFITDEKIENLALLRLHLTPGEFDFNMEYDAYSPKGLTIKINEPDKWKPDTSHSSKVKYGKYIIINPYTGEVIEQKRSKRDYIEAYY